jgi:predicted MFS family arabinose efflux permease
MKKVLQLPAFRRLLAVSMINELALSIGAVALALLVYRRTGSAIGAAAFFLSAEFGPALISPFFVARLDQHTVRPVLVVLYALQGFIFLTLASLVHRFSLAPVLALALIEGSFAITAQVLVRAAWTSVTTGPGLLRDANALMNTGYSVCFMVGPALGGALVALDGVVAALLVNVGAYALCVLIIGTARGLPRAARNRAPASGRLRAALRYARDEERIRRLLSLQAAGMLFFTISIPVEVVFAQRTLNAGAGGYGVLLAAWGGGAIIGSAIWARYRWLPSRLQISVGSFLLGGGFLVMAVAPSLVVATVGATLAGVGNGIQVVSVRTALQEAVSERWMALVLSLNESMFQAVPGAGIVIGGAIAAIAGARVALGVAAVGSLAVAATMWIKLSVGDSGEPTQAMPEQIAAAARGAATSPDPEPNFSAVRPQP